MRRLLTADPLPTMCLVSGCMILLSCACRAQPKAQNLARLADDPIIAEVLSKKIRSSQSDELRNIILGTLLGEYASEHRIEPLKSEIDAFVAFGNRVEHQVQEERDRSVVIEEIIETLNAMLKLDNDDSIYDSEYLEMISGMLVAEVDMVEASKEIQNERMEEWLKKTNKNMAATWITPWKINLALFKEYGGRVAFQQAGPEPVDAYHDFLREHEQKGSFQILDQKHAQAFWNYFTNEDLHFFMSETREEGLEILSTPWWLADDPSGD